MRPRTALNARAAFLVTMLVASLAPIAVEANGSPDMFMRHAGWQPRVVITGTAADHHSQLVVPGMFVGTFASGTVHGSAGAATPAPPLASRVRLEITGHAEPDRSELVLPRRLLVPGSERRLLERPASTTSHAPLALVAPMAEPAGSPLRTAVAGIAISLAIVLAGLWLARRRAAARVAVTSVAVAMVAIAMGAGLALANFPTWATFSDDEAELVIDEVIVSNAYEPIELRLTPHQFAALSLATPGEVRVSQVVMSDDADAIALHLTPEQHAGLGIAPGAGTIIFSSGSFVAPEPGAHGSRSTAPNLPASSHP